MSRVGHRDLAATGSIGSSAIRMSSPSGRQCEGHSLPGGRVLVRRFHVKHPVGDVDAGSAVPRSSTADVSERVPRAPSLPWREFTLPGSRRHVAMRQPPPARGNAPSGRR